MILFSTRQWRWFLVSLGTFQLIVAFPVKINPLEQSLVTIAQRGSVIVWNAAADEESRESAPQQRRPRYAGRYPRNFAEKYKEHNGDTNVISKVLAKGMTPAGM